MIRPTRAAIGLAVAACAVALSAYATEMWLNSAYYADKPDPAAASAAAALYGCALYWLLPLALALTAADLILCAWIRPARIERVLPEKLTLNKTHRVEFVLEEPEAPRSLLGRLSAPLEKREAVVWDRFPVASEVSARSVRLGFKAVVDGEPRRARRAGYDFKPTAKGDALFEPFDYELASPMRLWARRFSGGRPQPVKILPDVSEILGADLLSFGKWLQMVGAKKINAKGIGKEFFQLRGFAQGDSIRDVDWKATAKASKPIVKQYQEERDRRIYLMLDCGMAMAERFDGVSHFDCALRAMLLTAYAALKNDDPVGALAVNRLEPKHLPARKGLAQIGAMIRTLYNVEPENSANDVESAANFCLGKERRRSLIIYITHLNFEISDDAVGALARLRRRHAVLVANIKSPAAQAPLRRPPRTIDEAYLYDGARLYAQKEKELLLRLDAQRIPCVNCFPDEFAPKLINAYIKMRAQSEL